MTPNIGNAGVILDILPKIGEDATVTMRIRPSVSSVFAQETIGAGITASPVQLTRRRDLVAQSVRVKNSQTLALGGLIDTRDVNTVTKVPLLGDLPVLGSLFRSSDRDFNRSEIIVLITPHILNYAEPTPVHYVVNHTNAK